MEPAPQQRSLYRFAAALLVACGLLAGCVGAAPEKSMLAEPIDPIYAGPFADDEITILHAGETMDSQLRLRRHDQQIATRIYMRFNKEDAQPRWETDKDWVRRDLRYLFGSPSAPNERSNTGDLWIGLGTIDFTKAKIERTQNGIIVDTGWTWRGKKAYFYRNPRLVRIFNDAWQYYAARTKQDGLIPVPGDYRVPELRFDSPAEELGFDNTGETWDVLYEQMVQESTLQARRDEVIAWLDEVFYRKSPYGAINQACGNKPHIRRGEGSSLPALGTYKQEREAKEELRRFNEYPGCVARVRASYDREPYTAIYPEAVEKAALFSVFGGDLVEDKKVPSPPFPFGFPLVHPDQTDLAFEMRLAEFEGAVSASQNIVDKYRAAAARDARVHAAARARAEEERKRTAARIRTVARIRAAAQADLNRLAGSSTSVPSSGSSLTLQSSASTVNCLNGKKPDGSCRTQADIDAYNAAERARLAREVQEAGDPWDESQPKQCPTGYSYCHGAQMCQPIGAGTCRQ